MKVMTTDDTSATIEVTFTDLHWSEEAQADIGNAHFKLHLLVDEDGDGQVETTAGFGVNLHVEDPANGA